MISFISVAAVEAVELVGNRRPGRAMDKCVGSLSVHTLIHGSAPVTHKSIAIFKILSPIIRVKFSMYPAGKDLL